MNLYLFERSKQCIQALIPFRKLKKTMTMYAYRLSFSAFENAEGDKEWFTYLHTLLLKPLDVFAVPLHQVPYDLWSKISFCM